jgi:hypothetical protein
MDKIKPTSENKNILIMMANTGQCYAKLSYKSHKQYDQIQSGLTIPVIFFSTIIGTASFTGLSKQYYFYMSMIIGFVNIVIGVLTTILRYFKISEYNEMYRVAHISWDSYVRDVLLILPNIKDEHFDEFYQKKIHEFNALVDTTPIFPKKIIDKFQKYVKHIPNQYIKPAQINKQIISLQTYIDQFKLENHGLTCEIEEDKKNNCCRWFKPKDSLPLSIHDSDIPVPPETPPAMPHPPIRTPSRSSTPSRPSGRSIQETL